MSSRLRPPTEPTTWLVWSEHHDDERDAGEVVALTPLGALLMACAQFADDDLDEDRGFVANGKFPGETWFVRAKDSAGEPHVFFQREELPECFEVVTAAVEAAHG